MSSTRCEYSRFICALFERKQSPDCVFINMSSPVEQTTWIQFSILSSRGRMSIIFALQLRSGGEVNRLIHILAHACGARKCVRVTSLPTTMRKKLVQSQHLHEVASFSRPLMLRCGTETLWEIVRKGARHCTLSLFLRILPLRCQQSFHVGQTLQHQLAL